MDQVLIIFAKYPKPGLVKTRLAKDIGKQNAALIYKLLVDLILTRVRDRSFKSLIFFSPSTKHTEFKRWLGNDKEFHPQRGRDLGQRLSNAFQFAFKNGAKRVVVIGSDSPTIDKKVIKEAFNRLEDSRCVIGPSPDGGYYLIGLSTFLPDIFKGIRWSSSEVLARTQDKLNELDIKFKLLKPHIDIDSVDDLKSLRRILRTNSRVNLDRLGNIVRVL